MRDTVFYNRIPPVDHAIGYVTVPDDGRCENIPRDILRAHMDYKEGGPLCITGVTPHAVAALLRAAQARCRRLGEAAKQNADAYGIDQLLFYTKEIFLADAQGEAAAAWLSAMEEEGRLGLTCRLQAKGHAVVPMLFSFGGGCDADGV